MSEVKPDIYQQMQTVRDRIGIQAQGLDYLLDNAAPMSLVNRFMSQQQTRLAEAVAAATGAQLDEVADNEKRTPEQARLMAEMAGKEMLARWARFRNSDYTQLLEGLFSHYKGTGGRAVDLDTVSDSDQTAIHNIALYLYATHPHLDPMASGSMSEAERAKAYAYLDAALEIKSSRISLSQAVTRALGISPRKRKTPTKSKGITESFERALSITNKSYQWALTPYPNEIAYIARIGDTVKSKVVFAEGKVDPLRSAASEAEIRKAAVSTNTDLSKIPDIQLLRQIYTVVYHNFTNITEDTITVHYPTFCKAMGIDPTLTNANDVLGKIASFSEWAGFTGDGSIYALLNLVKYDASKGDLVLAVPYMNMIKRSIEGETLQQLPDGETYQNPAYSYLIHSTIGSERNKAAIEIVHEIIALLHQRGGVSDQQIAAINRANRAKKAGKQVPKADGAPKNPTVTAHKKYSAIVSEIPLLDERIKQSTANNANSQLKRAFSKAFELLRSKTDAYEHFIGLEVPDTVPTVTTLNKPLIITHKGINPKYETRR